MTSKTVVEENDLTKQYIKRKPIVKESQPYKTQCNVYN